MTIRKDNNEEMGIYEFIYLLVGLSIIIPFSIGIILYKTKYMSIYDIINNISNILLITLIILVFIIGILFNNKNIGYSHLGGSIIAFLIIICTIGFYIGFGLLGLAIQSTQLLVSLGLGGLSSLLSSNNIVNYTNENIYETRPNLDQLDNLYNDDLNESVEYFDADDKLNSSIEISEAEAELDKVGLNENIEYCDNDDNPPPLIYDDAVNNSSNMFLINKTPILNNSQYVTQQHIENLTKQGPGYGISNLINNPFDYVVGFISNITLSMADPSQLRILGGNNYNKKNKIKLILVLILIIILKKK